MSGRPPADAPVWVSRRSTSSALNVVTVLIFVIFGFGIRYLLERLSPGTHAGYVPVVLGASSAIALYSYTRRKTLEGQEKTLFWVSELISLAVLLRVFFAVRGGLASLQNEFSAFKVDFFAAFFNPTYLLMLFCGLVSWVLSNYLAAQYDFLYEREQDVFWDDLGKIQNSLKQVRGHIITVVVFLLIFFIFITAIASVPIELQGVLSIQAAPAAPVWMSMVFGALVLVMLSLTQFILLRSRWEIDRSTVSLDVHRQWLVSAAILLVIIGVLSAVLPTGYSIGFFELVALVGNFLLQVATLLFYAILLPFTLLGRLFTSKPVDSPEPPQVQIPPIVTTESPGGIPPVLQLIRDILLWVLTFAVVGFAFYQFATSNSILLKRLGSLGVMKWLVDVFRSILAFFRGAGQALQEQINRLQKAGVRLPALRRRAGQRLSAPDDARGRIIFRYKELVGFAGEHGIPRRESQTPYQYREAFTTQAPAVSPQVAEVTDVFVEARYSPHDLQPQAADQFEARIETIEKALDELSENKAGDDESPAG